MSHSLRSALALLGLAGCSQRPAVNEPNHEPAPTGTAVPSAGTPACESLPLWNCVEWAGCVSLEAGTGELRGATVPRLCDQLLPSNQPSRTSSDAGGRHIRYAVPACEESAPLDLTGMPSCPPCADVPACSHANAS